MAKNDISISVVADVKSLKSGVDDVNAKLATIGKSARTAGKLLLTAFAFKAASAGFDALKGKFGEVMTAGSDLQQSTGAIDAVFGKQAAGMKKVGDTAAQSFGLSKVEFNELSTVLGAGFKNQGIKDFATTTTSVVGLGADLAAQFGGSTKDAVSAIGSLMRGEADPIERYGVGIKQTAVSAELAAQGQSKLTGAAKTTAEAQARLKLLFEQTGSAQGTFARESDTLAGAQQRNAAATENLKAKIGTALLPVMTQLQAYIGTTLLPLFERFATYLIANLPAAIETVKAKFASIVAAVTPVVTAVAQVVSFLVQNRVAIASVVIVLGTLALGYKLVALQMTIMAAGGFLSFITKIMSATKIWAVVQGVMNVVLAANPIGIVIIAIAALVAGIIFAYKNSEKFRAVLTAAWNGIKAVSIAVFNAVKNFIVGAFNAIKAGITSDLNNIKSTVSRVWNAIKATNSAIWNGIKAAISAVLSAIKSTVSSTWNGIKSTVSSALSGIKSTVSSGMNAVKSALTSAWNAAKAVVKSALTAMAAAVTSGINKIKTTISGLRGAIAGYFGNAGSILINAGAQIINGLIAGIQRGIARVRSILQSVTSMIPDWKGPKERDAVLLYDAGRLIMKSLANGFIKGESGVKAQLQGTTALIAKSLDDVMAPTLTPSVAMSASLSPTGSFNAGQSVQQRQASDAEAFRSAVASAFSGMTVQVENPWTGEYHEARMKQVAGQAVNGFVSRFGSAH